MIRRIRLPRIFYGWWLVVIGGFLALWAAGFYMYGFSALFKPLASEFGFNRAVTSSVSGLGRLLTGFQAPVTGWITDKFGARWVLIFGVLLFGLGLILMSLINSLWTFYLVWGILVSTGASLNMGLPMDKTITNWFVRKRGLALSTRQTLAGLGGGMILPLVVAPLIATLDWRKACIIGGLVIWLVGFPLVWFFIKPHRPEYYGLLPDGTRAETESKKDTEQTIANGIKYAAEFQEIEFTLRQAMKTPAYWLLIVSQTGFHAAQGALVTHFIPLVTDMGIEPLRAAAIFGMIVFTAIPTRFVAGPIADRLKKQHLRFLLGGAYFLQASGLIVFLVSRTITTVYILYILYYVGFGVSLPMLSIIKARYFGRKSFGSIQGTAATFVTPIGVAAPIYFGWIYDTTSSYTNAFMVLAGLATFSTVVMLFISPPKPPSHVTSIRDIV